jgi:hypothetical protein
MVALAEQTSEMFRGVEYVPLPVEALQVRVSEVPPAPPAGGLVAGSPGFWFGEAAGGSCRETLLNVRVLADNLAPCDCEAFCEVGFFGAEDFADENGDHEVEGVSEAAGPAAATALGVASCASLSFSSLAATLYDETVWEPGFVTLAGVRFLTGDCLLSVVFTSEATWPVGWDRIWRTMKAAR